MVDDLVDSTGGGDARGYPAPSVTSPRRGRPVLLFLATEDWYFASHRLPIARGAVQAGFRVVVVTRVRYHARQIEATGAEVIPLSWRRRGGSLRSEFRALVRLVGLYRALRPALVHHVALKPVVYGALAARLAGVPARVNGVAGLGHMFTASTLRVRVLRPFFRLALKAALAGRNAFTVLQNPDDRDLLIRTRIAKAEHLVLIRGAGVDLDAFKPSTPAAGPPVALLPSRMLWSKGVGDFVAAAKLLRDEGIMLRCVLVGESDPDNPAAISREQLQAWHNSGVVEWLGHRSDMPAVLAMSHIVCLPSTYGEGIPKSLLEAAAAGLPLVATDIPGCREVVRSDNGLLVPTGDVGALAAALRRLAQDEDLRRRMGERGRAIAVAEFGEKRVVMDTLNLYRRMLT